MTTTPRSAPRPGLRERRRRAAMTSAQRHAVAMFTARGFDDVTVEEVAEAAEVSPVSLYRWFGSKEGIVLWDEYDPGIFAAVRERLADLPPLVAVRDALAAEIAGLYDAEQSLVLDRTRLIHREPTLLAATSHQQRALRDALALLFAGAEPLEDDPDETPYACRVLAGVAVGALTTAIDDWQRQDGRVPLGDLVVEAFDVVRRSPWTT